MKFNVFTYITGKGNICTRFIVLFLVFLAPVYIVGFSIYLFGRHSVARQIREAQENRVEFYIDGLAAEISRIRVLQYDFFSDVYLNRLTDTIGALSNYERDMNILYIEKGLHTIMSVSRYIVNVSVMIPSIGKKITSRNMDELSGEDWTLIEHHDEMPVPGIGYRDDAICLYAEAFTGYNPRNRRQPKYFFEIQLSGDTLRQAMQDLLQTGEDFVCRWEGADFVYTSLKDPAVLEGIGRLFGKPNGSYTVAGERYQLYQTTPRSINLAYISVMSEELLYRPINVYLLLFLLFSLVVVTTIIFFSYYFRKMIQVPLKRLHDAFLEVENGVLDVHIEHPGQDEFKDIFYSFNQMTTKLNQLIDQVFRQKMRVQKAELRQLQAQINPHFLFNCFFVLSRRIQYRDMETASALASHLGEYFKFLTRTALDTVPLAEELSHARIYTRIQASRFSGRIQVSFDELPPQYTEMTVDRLIVQPVIENAFEHGLKNKIENGMLRVFFTEREEALIINIEDNGDEIEDAAIESLNTRVRIPEDDFAAGSVEVTSILNIHRRICYRMGNHAGLRFRRGPLGGLLAELILVTGTAAGQDRGEPPGGIAHV
jgi:two-component system sensor histidine kinase YesM